MTTTTSTAQTETPLPADRDDAITAIMRHAPWVTDGAANDAIRVSIAWAKAPVDPSNPRESLREAYRPTVEACAKVAYEIQKMD